MSEKATKAGRGGRRGQERLGPVLRCRAEELRIFLGAKEITETQLRGTKYVHFLRKPIRSEVARNAFKILPERQAVFFPGQKCT